MATRPVVAALDRAKQYQCAQCGGIFDFGWTDEEAKAEMAANGWGEMPPEDMAIVCDDCYNGIMAPAIDRSDIEEK
jgi:DNA-directed RNA polymerase subunit RPC12/RpoP